MEHELVDRIYECSFVPEHWPAVLDDLAGIAGARGGVFFAANTSMLNWAASAGLVETFSSYLGDGWLKRCTRRACWLLETRPGFLVEHDIWTPGELADNPVYRDFLRPRGLGWSAGMAIPLPTGDKVVFTLEKDYAAGPVEQASIDRLDTLRPHLARSALMAARLQLDRAKASADALAGVGLPALMLDRTGNVLAANALAEEQGTVLRWRAWGRLGLADPAADKLMRSAIAGLNGTGADARSFPVRDAEGRATMILHIVPLRRTARDLVLRTVAMVILTPVKLPKAPPSDLMRSLFDLTPAEARVAHGLLAGESLDDIATGGGVSRNTVRTQLRAVMAKTGCTRQAEVVALLAGLPAGRVH